MFYNFNFKGRWVEFKKYFPKRIDSFKVEFYNKYINNNGWFYILLDKVFIISNYMHFFWYAFVLNYDYMYISLIRKVFSYSRIDYFLGFDITKVFVVSTSLWEIHQPLYGVFNNIKSFSILGENSNVRSPLTRFKGTTNDLKFLFNFDWFLLIETSKLYKRAQHRTIYTCFYYTRRLHNFLLLTESPWPLFMALSASYMLIGVSAFFNYYEGGLFLIWCGLFLIVFAFYSWCKDFIRETSIYGRLTELMIKNIKLAFWLFITTEALLFVSFFWAFFHMALEPAIQIGSIWPPFEGIKMDSLLVPLANTLFLLASGAAFTWVQYHYIAQLSDQVIYGFIVTLTFSCFFLLCQWHEYVVSASQLNDGVFGSTLYMLTAFHGVHVLIGTIFIAVCFLRFCLGQFRVGDPVGITLAAWYWHFVDVVWLLVFIWVYLWGTWFPAEIGQLIQSSFIS